MEAWQYGPVVRSIYDEYHQFRRNPIDIEMKEYICPLNSAKQKHVRDVLAEYLSYSAYELVESIHQDAPWREAFKSEESNIISKKSMREFYKKRQEEQDAILNAIPEE